jgi:hypothetical protein
MAFTLTTATNILKNRYIGPIREQLEGSSVLFSEIKKETRLKLSGKNWTVPLHTRRNLSAGVGRAENTTLPTASEQSYDVAIVPNTYQYGRIEITGPTFEAAKDDAGAFVRALASETEGVSRDMIKSFNRQLHSDGTDALAYWTAADDASPFSLDDGSTFLGGAGNPFIFLRVGDTIDVVDQSVLPTQTLLGTALPVTAVAVPGANTVAVTTSANPTGTASGDFAVLTGTLGQQLMGIRGIISAVDPPLLSGGLHGLPVASKTFWRAQVFGAAGVQRQLTTLMMRRVLSTIAGNSDFKDRDVEFILTSYDCYDEYYNVVVTDKRQVNTLQLDGGFKGLDFCGIPVVPDPDCRRNTMYFIVPESMRFFESAPLDWMEKDGSVLHRREDKDMYTGTMFAYFNLGCTARNANGLLTDISISAS